MNDADLKPVWIIAEHIKDLAYDATSENVPFAGDDESESESESAPFEDELPEILIPPRIIIRP